VPLQVTFDHTQVGYISRQSVNIVDKHSIKDASARIVAKAIKLGPFHQPTTPPFVLVGPYDLPAALPGKSLQLRKLGVNRLAFPLLFSRYPGIDGNP
jgi:hypothetical protein